MNHESVSVNVSRKVNLGNFESIGFSFSASASLQEDDELEQVKEQLLSELQQFMDKEVKKAKQGIAVAERVG